MLMDSVNIIAWFFATVHTHKTHSSVNTACTCLFFTAILNTILYSCECSQFVNKWHDDGEKSVFSLVLDRYIYCFYFYCFV